MPAVRFTLASAAAALLLAGSSAAAALAASGSHEVSRFAARMKAVQRAMLFEREAEEGEAWEPEGLRLRPRDEEEAAELLLAPLGPPPARAFPLLASVGLVPNVRANNPAGDNASATQSEVAIGALGDNVLVAFNDGQGYYTTKPGFTRGDTQGYAYSTNGGQSFVDGGVPPAPTGCLWDSDPVVTVNEGTGEFWFTALTSRGGFNGIGIVKATFSGGSISWGTPRNLREVADNAVFLDKPWTAVDPGSGRLYVSYTAFDAFSGYDTIDVQSSLDGANWTDPIQLSAPADAGYVQGSRPAVGPSGEVYVVWNVIDPNPPYSDFFAIRKSTNGGASYSSQATVARAFSNFGAGAPGFNRGRGVTFPSITVDRTTGPHRGRVYVAWNESVDYYYDNLGTSGGPTDAEPNDTAPQAVNFALADSIRGFLGSGDTDFYKFNTTQGTTMVLFAPFDPTLGLSMRLLCSDADAQLAWSAPFEPNLPPPNSAALIVFTAPVTGTYYLRLRPTTGSGNYILYTGVHSPRFDDRARDHRDAFVAGSDNGSAWSSPVRVNNSPPYLDDWLPEVAVSSLSEVYVANFDWRDASAAICNATSQVYLTKSTDGGASWSTLGALSDQPSNWTDWTLAKSNLEPNQGDYVSLFADCQAVYGGWGDVRDPDVNVYTGRYPPGFQASVATFVSATVSPQQVILVWQPSAPTLSGNVYRRPPAGAWVMIGTATDQAGVLTFTDGTVVEGSTYEYRLGIQQATEVFTCPVRVVVPTTVVRLALGLAQPNPASGAITVNVELPTSAPAVLRLLDITGRQVDSQEVGSLGPGRHPVTLDSAFRLRSGLYFLHLEQSGQEASSRISIVR